MRSVIQPALFLVLRLSLVIHSIFLWIPFLYLHRCEDDTEDKYGCSDVERIDDRVGYYALRGFIGNAESREEEREYVAYKRTRIAEKRLDGVSERLLLLVHHVADKHLERLHSHVDARVEEHQRDKTEDHCRADSHSERSCIRQQTHHEHSHRGSDEKIWDAASEATPCLVAKRADYRLHKDAHQRGQYPEIAKVVRVCSQCGKDARYVGALQGVSYLYAKESETQIPEFPE